MSNVLLVEPDYRSKFPPLGLLRISSYHKERGDSVTFARGKVPALRQVFWKRVYVASLFTYELPRTVETIGYYYPAVENPSDDIIVGGIGATLLPDYIRERARCTVVTGALDRPGMLEPNTPCLDVQVPDYSILDSTDKVYKPEDTYFCKVTKGCVRRCNFCAVPVLEPVFGYIGSVRDQIAEARSRFGERQHLILLDNNVLALDEFERIIEDIRSEGFERGAKRNNRLRTVDFNQGIDARLVTPKVAKLLASICLSPVRLAFDFDAMEGAYRRAVAELAQVGFTEFTTYIMFNHEDSPLSFHRRLRINAELSKALGIRVTGFPMRYIPINDIQRNYVSKQWHWRYLRGIQCVLSATHGMVSPNPDFLAAAFGESYEEFLEILSMPDRYIIHRNKYRHGEAASWRALFRRLSAGEKEEFLAILAELHYSRGHKKALDRFPRYFDLLEHYYPGSDSLHD